MLGIDEPLGAPSPSSSFTLERTMHTVVIELRGRLKPKYRRSPESPSPYCGPSFCPGSVRQLGGTHQRRVGQVR